MDPDTAAGRHALDQGKRLLNWSLHLAVRSHPVSVHAHVTLTAESADACAEIVAYRARRWGEARRGIRAQLTFSECVVGMQINQIDTVCALRHA